MRAARLVLAATVTGALALTGAGSAVDAAPSNSGHCLSPIAPAGKGWQALTPDFRFGPKRVQQAVVTPYVPDRIWATNGTALVRTDDAGCHWIGYIVPGGGNIGLPVTLPDPVGGLLHIPTTTQITSLAAPSSATVSARVYAALDDHSTLGDAPSIAYFDGENWHWRQSSGLPTSGIVSQVAASPTTPTIAYAVVDPVSALSQSPGLYATSDGGSSWQLVNGSIRSADDRDLRVDPVVPTTVYALTTSGLRISNDGGRTFVASGRPGSDIASYDVAEGSGASQLVQGHTSSASFDRSNDGGRTWSAVPAPVTAADVAMQPLIDQVAVSDGDAVWLRLVSLPGCPRTREVTPSGGAPDDLQLTAPSARGYALVGVRGDQILRGIFSLSACSRAVVVGSTPIELLPGAAQQYFPATLLPATRSLTLPAGAQRDVSYRLLLPRSPSPIDVMFLVDTTASTEDTIQGLKQDIGQVVNDLTGAGLDVQFGLADFKDYAPRIDNRGDGEPGDYPYRLDARIGPVGPALTAALGQLHSKGGGDDPEADLTALYQSSTGAGQRWPGKKPPQRWIPHAEPGQAAGYRPGSLRLAVLATDERFHKDPKYLTPAWGTTVAALRAHGIHFVGLSVRKTSGQPPVVQGYHSLGNEQQFATDVGSFAPYGGVDCNGDLIPDVPAGAPFVCKVNVVVDHAVNVGPLQSTDAKVEPVRLTPAITTAAQSIVDMRAVTLQLAAPSGVAALISPTVVPQVNLKTDNTLGYTVRYSCPRSTRKHVYDVRVNATAAGRVVASAPMHLSCGPVPPAPPKPRIPPAAAAAVPAVAARPAAPAPPPPAPGNPIPNTNPNPNPAINANVGFAGQEEEQRQLAFAGADAGVAEDTGETLAMSRLGGGAALLLAATAGWVARRRLADRAHYAAAWHRR
jgi:hypothetical protein